MSSVARLSRPLSYAELFTHCFGLIATQSAAQEVAADDAAIRLEGLDFSIAYVLHKRGIVVEDAEDSEGLASWSFSCDRH